jgi:subtilisin family serine protease
MRTQVVKLIAWLVLVALLTATPLAIAAPAPAPPGASLAPFDPYILTVIEAEGQADFFVVHKVQADLSAAESLPTKEARGQYVFGALTEVAAKTQGPILGALTAEGVAFDPFWIRNMIRVRGGDKALLLEMAARPDVAEIFYEYEPVPDVEPPSPAGAAPEAVEWNIDRVEADLVWTLGITGTGAVLASLDTGADWDHPALVNSYRPQIPGAPDRHDYNWWDGPDGFQEPSDYDSHGTHTIGTMVGDDGGVNQVGMAPGAHWIACAGLGSSVTPLDCFQFFLAPTQLDGSNPRPDLAPHVINNSWTSATDYHSIIQTLYAAGIFYAKSAGNTGPSCGSVTNPGQWPEVTAAANFAQGDVIAGGSSRGPVTIGHDTLIKPDIAAPGTNVRSTLPGGGYGLKSGTSMASPHVAGAVGLLISAKPELAGQIDVLQMILKLTAEPKVDLQCPPNDPSGVPNNVWGYGILDAHAAVLAAQAMGLGGIEGEVYDSNTLAPIADAAITFEDTATNWQLFGASQANGEYARILPAATYDITATHYGYLPSVIPGVLVQDGLTTTQNIPLDSAPVWTVSGTVTETQTGDPLAATILFEETPITVGTDPASGAYSTDVAQGTWWMLASSPGHAREERLVTVDQDMSQDFSLLAIHNYYMRTADDCGGPTFAWLDASGGASHCLSDDSYQHVDLPDGRSFTFYGNTYTSLFIGSNGLVTFGAGNNKWSGPIPDPALPNNGIYAFSTDLDPSNCAQGTIYSDLIDDRYFVVEFDQVEHFPDSDPETFEIVLDLDSGKVSIQFMTVSDASEAVVGLENSDGTEATQYAFADPVLITDGVAVDFYPTFSTPPPVGDAGAISGTVADAGTGDPIAGAEVTAVAFTGSDVFNFTANASGVYSDSLCPDWYTMTATAPGYHPSEEVLVTVVSGTLTVQGFELEQIEADLWITKTATLTATPGAYLTYTLDFGSFGPDVVPWGEVEDGLPNGVEYITSTGGTYQEAEHAVTWQWYDVISGFADSATIVVQVSATITVGMQVCNHAHFVALGDAAPLDPNPDNDNTTACTTIEAMQTAHHVYLPLIVKGFGP